MREGRHRWVLTFVFGLIHGFGFAGILRDLGLPRQYLATSLLSFNVGVELGQLAVVAPVWLALRWTLRFPERGRRWAARVVSIGIVVMGLSWFAQRVGWT